MTRQGRIDVHHHLLPDFFKAAQTAGGFPGTAYRPFPEWSPERSLGLMDRQGIASAILSFTAPGIWFGDIAATRETARRCNDCLAEMKAAHPGRFGGFAMLPLPDVDASLAELGRSLDELGLDGMVHLTQVDGRYPGHADYRPVYEELNRRGAVVFLHPTYAPASEEKDYLVPRPIVDYPGETGRAVAHLLFTGALADFPRIRFIAPHAGGTLPFLAHRIGLFDDLTPHREKYPEGARHYLERLWYDTALSGDPAVLDALRALARPDRLLFGTDYPYIPGEIADSETAGLDAYAGFTGDDRRAMERDNALALFPAFA